MLFIRLEVFYSRSVVFFSICKSLTESDSKSPPDTRLLLAGRDRAESLLAIRAHWSSESVVASTAGLNVFLLHYDSTK